MLEIQMLRAMLVRSPVETGNTLLESGRKDDPCYKMAKYLAELFSSVLWKVELASDETGY